MTNSALIKLNQSLSQLFLIAVSATFIVAAQPAGAVETEILRDESFAEFNKGVSTGTELLADGRLQVGPKAVLKEKSGEGIVWDVAVDAFDGSVFYATGHSGKVFRMQSNGKLDVWADLSEVEATALAIDPKGGLLIGASPGGKIYRVTEKGKPEVFFETGEKYIWDMIFDRNGLLYAATGTSGKVYRIRGERNGEVYYDSDATNAMALAFDKDGNLLAATQGKGYVLRISESGTGYILYASSQDEIRSLTVDDEGNIYAAANSVQMSSVFDKSTTGSGGFGSGLDGKGIVAQIHPNGYVHGLWAAPEGPIHQMIADNKTSSILAAAGKNGKLYRVNTTDASYSVVTDVDEPMIIALTAGKNGVMLGTANKAVIYELESSAPLVSGMFASRALDAKSTVKWGNLMYDGEVSTASQIRLETRSGNTPEPSDGTWSPWTDSEPVAQQIVKIASPVAQYLQYRITLESDQGTGSNFIDGIQIFYVQKNVAPVLRKIELAKVPGSPAAGQAAALAAAAARMQQASSSQGGSNAQEAGEEAAKAASAAARAAQAAVMAKIAQAGGTDLQNSQKVNISWTAEDPNDDKLRYNLFYKGEDEEMWKLIEENLTATKHQFSTEAIPDGTYRFKLDATDRFENPETSASTVSITSRIYTVDNSPPDITDIHATRTGENEYEVTATASDKTSIISAAEYNLNAAEEWRTLTPADSIFDFQQESFRVRISPEKQQPEHTLSIRVYDREGNSRVEKILLR